MPYNRLSELPDNVKALPKHAQEIYMSAFNSAFKQYAGEEHKAHATAWEAVKTKYKKNEAGDWVAKEAVHPHGEHVCVCPECGEEATVGEGVKCNTQSCPECETQMRAKDIGERRGTKEAQMPGLEKLQAIYSEIMQEAGKRNAALDAARVRKIKELCEELLSAEEPEEGKAKEALKEAESVLTWLQEQKMVKVEDGVEYPADAYAYVPNAEKSSTWQLRTWEDAEKKITKAQLGRVAAALSPGGLARIPKEDLAAVKRKIRAEYRKLKVEEDDIPRWAKEAETREFLQSYIPLTEAKFDKGKASVIVIKAGFNESQDRYYPADVLKRDYGIFEGQKMYADHPTEEEDKSRPERSIKDWVATLVGVTCDESGTITGVAEIIEPWLLTKLASLRDKGMLSEMGISINAVGSASKAKVDGKDTLVIEKLVTARSVDFVTEPGAGGVVTFYEADKQRDVDLIELSALKERRPDLIKAIEAEARVIIMREVKRMEDQAERITALEGQIETLTTERNDLKTQMQEAEKAQAKAEAQATIKEAVDKAELPAAAKERIQERFKDAESADGIEEAIKSEIDYIAKLAEAGKVKGLGGSTPNPEKDKKELMESFKQMHPEWTEAQLATAVEGK